MREFSFNGRSFLVFDNVYMPSDDSFMVADAIVSEGCSRYDLSVDVGCGCGLLSILLAEKSKFTVAVDLSLEAARNAMVNAKRNNIWCRVGVVVGDLLKAFKCKPIFDCIVFNPPYLPEDELDKLIPYNFRIAWSGGRSGRMLIDRFLKELRGLLKLGGVVYLVHSSLSNFDETLNALSSLGLKFEVLSEKRFFYESLYLLRVVRCV